MAGFYLKISYLNHVHFVCFYHQIMYKSKVYIRALGALQLATPKPAD